MRKLWLLIIVVLGVMPAILALADTPKPSDDPNRVQVRVVDPIGPIKLQYALTLTDEQFSSVTKLYNTRKDSEKLLEENKDLSKEDKAKKKSEIRDEYIKGIRNLVPPLTQEQKNKFEELLKSSEAGQTKITDEQRQKINGLIAKYIEQKAAISNDPSLDDATKTERIRQLTEELRNATRKVLEPKDQPEDPPKDNPNGGDIPPPPEAPK